MAEFPPSPRDIGAPDSWTIVAPADGQVLHRIVVAEKPAIGDFLPNRDKHNPQMRGESWLLYNGVSMFEAIDQAEALRDRLRPQQHIAALALSPGRGITLARTRRSPGHYTVWGRPEELLAMALAYQGYPLDKEYR